MARQRSIFSLILVLITTLLMSCGGPSVATPPPTYTTAQIEQIKEYVPEITAVQARAEELQTLINQKEWVKVGNFIHGPMAEARLTMSYVIPHLLKKDQTPARNITRDLLGHLVKIDQAASAGNKLLAFSNYQSAFDDVNKFLNLLPDTSSESEAS
ncbi:MAG: photosystem II protein PsbQ [Scytonematopsis contorta HA4267-MV1]|jgi:photosystem II protein PsbQ|nr:photosystem II protein PsbQ [Scytonematopsis contorta HA4267-MV1]